MPWTIARPPTAGRVLLYDSEAELGSFHEVTFEEIEPPSSTPSLGDQLRERLPSTHGYFQLNGDVPRELREAFTEGKRLILSFETRGVQVDVGVERRSNVVLILLHESGIIGTQFPFAATGPVHVAVSQPADS